MKYKSPIQVVKKQLLNLGVTKIKVGYSGAGDSGSIDEFEFLGPEGNEVLAVGDKTVTIRVLDEWVCEQLPPGWEINAGSQGEIIIDLRAGTAVINHGENYMETKNSELEVRF